MKTLRPVENQAGPHIAWLMGQLAMDGRSVSSFVPASYPACVRVMNPMVRNGHPFKWADLAKSAGIEPNGNMDGERIRTLASSEYGVDHNLEIGTVNVLVAEHLSHVLSRHTSTPEFCYFGIWAGYGDLMEYVSPAVTYTFPPDREIIFFQGPVRSAVEPVGDPFWHRRCMRWMPADHNWCVGNDIYGDSIYVAGSQECIQDIMNCSALETYLVDFSAPVHRI